MNGNETRWKIPVKVIKRRNRVEYKSIYDKDLAEYLQNNGAHWDAQKSVWVSEREIQLPSYAKVEVEDRSKMLEKLDYPEFFHIFKEFVESQKHYLVFYMDGSYKTSDERPRYDDFNVLEYFNKTDILLDETLTNCKFLPLLAYMYIYLLNMHIDEVNEMGCVRWNER